MISREALDCKDVLSTTVFLVPTRFRDQRESDERQHGFTPRAIMSCRTYPMSCLGVSFYDPDTPHEQASTTNSKCSKDVGARIIGGEDHVRTVHDSHRVDPHSLRPRF